MCKCYIPQTAVMILCVNILFYSDVFTEDRFLTVVTKFDMTYEEDEPVHFDEVKSKVQGSIAIATKSDTSDIAVIKVSGRWAFEACMLESLPTSVNLRRKAARSLSSYHDAMGGQGESHISLPSDELVKQLKDASDISQVEMRFVDKYASDSSKASC